MLSTKDYIRFAVLDPVTCAPIHTFEGAELAAHALNGDFVRFDGATNAVTLVTRADHPMLAGTLDLTSKYRYGFTSRGTPIYMFFPFDESYPPMLAGSTERDITCNRVVLAKFEHWNESDKLPRAAVVRMLGKSGDLATELEGLYWRYSPWAPGRKELSTKCAGAITSSLSSTHPRELVDWTSTVNIDPPGCRDVDDVVSIRGEPLGVGQQCVEVAISIADVAAVVQERSPCDVAAARTGQSLYQSTTPAGPRHMLPAAVSEGTTSLLPSPEPRQAVSVFCSVDLLAGTVSGIRWAETFVINRASHTYESIMSTADFPVKSLQTVAHALRTTCGMPAALGGPGDSHGWVEALMVFYNVEAAKLLSANGCGLLRCHAKPDAERAAKFAAINPALAWLAFSSAEYVPVAASAASYEHWGLNQALYCHASSPLRRYADLINQRCLKQILSGCCATAETSLALACQLNRLQKLAKSHDRDVTFATAIDLGGSAGTVQGQVLEVILDASSSESIPALKYVVYVQQWERTVKVLSSGPGPTVGDTVSLEYFCDMRKRCWKRRVVLRLTTKSDEKD